ncbi:hypothetical protein P3T24_003533 [Paraburkholderia sp. GAS33]|jgi:hypothetical protein
MTLMEMLVRLMDWSLMGPVKRPGRLGITRYPFLGGAARPH